MDLLNSLESTLLVKNATHKTEFCYLTFVYEKSGGLYDLHLFVNQNLNPTLTASYIGAVQTWNISHDPLYPFQYHWTRKQLTLAECASEIANQLKADFE